MQFDDDETTLETRVQWPTSDDEEEAALLLSVMRALAMSLGTGAANAVRQSASNSQVFQQLYAAAMGWIAGAHGQASWLGRSRASNKTPFSEADRLFGMAAAIEQSPFLRDFIGALSEADSRYVDDDGQGKRTPRVKPIQSRADLYGARVGGSANEAWFDALPEDLKVEWVLGPNEEHCVLCPAIAAAGPYTRSTLPTFPRAGQTDCGVNCKCHLVSSDGRTSFVLPV